MILGLSLSWKLVLAAALIAVMIVSFRARAPRQALPGRELRRLMLSALALYAAGGLASMTHHPALAALVYAGGISVCSLAAWLSRGSDAEDPPGGADDPVDEHPPPQPDGIRAFDWDRFEQEFRAYSDRTSASC